jgi:hypothetical protein
MSIPSEVTVAFPDTSVFHFPLWTKRLRRERVLLFRHSDQPLMGK